MSAPPAPAFPSLFVTGTDTGVGKTLVAAALVHALAARGARAAGMKPVAAGASWREGAWRHDDVERLRAVASIEVDAADLCSYLLREAAAPHIAAALEGVELRWPVVERAVARLRARCDAIVVEGVGGFLVPLGADWNAADLALRLGLPVVMVVGLRLGCLNHAALTAEAIAARGLTLAGWVANQVDPDMKFAASNLDTLARLLPAPCLGRIGWREGIGAPEAAAALDLDAVGRAGAA